MVTQALATETAAIEVQFTSGDNSMSDVAYVSNGMGLLLTPSVGGAAGLITGRSVIVHDKAIKTGSKHSPALHAWEGKVTAISDILVALLVAHIKSIGSAVNGAVPLRRQRLHQSKRA
jgi:hypothetical protein